MIREIIREGLKQGGIEVIKSTLVWAVWRVRERYFPDPPPKSTDTKDNDCDDDDKTKGG